MKIRPAASVRGTVKIPGDKSISHRAAMIAALADGRSRIENFAASEDCGSTLRCLRELGVYVESEENAVAIEGRPGGFSQPASPLDCGNSGTTMRLMAGILAGQPVETVLTGDDSLRNRPMRRVIGPLERMGASIRSENGTAPLTIEGRRLSGIDYELPVASAQLKSCLLLAGVNADGFTSVTESVPTRDHTERMLRYFGAEIDENSNGEAKRISVRGGQKLTARPYSVPGDVSSAAFFIVAAACMPGSEIVIEGVGLNPTRTALIGLLRCFGVQLDVFDASEVCGEPVGNLTVRGGLGRTGTSGENRVSGPIVANLIDEIPILAVLGTQIDGGLEIRDAGELRVKESDRIAAVVENLRRMGAQVEEFSDGLRVERSVLTGAKVNSLGDHRIAMSFAVAGLMADGEATISGADSVAVSFPDFFQVLESVAVR
jgi:3-phosphoshikimate 1-carboxyvinyltransferase